MAVREVTDSEAIEVGDEDEEEDPESLHAILRKALDDAKGAPGADDDSDSIFSEPLKESKEVATVSMEDGLDLIDKAQQRQRGKDGKFLATDEAPAGTPAEAKAEPAKATDAPPAYDDVLASLSEPQRAAVAARVSAADEFGTIFTANRSHLATYGETPQAAFKRLADINAYATQNPSEYFAWAMGQLGGDKVDEVFAKAAERFGLKVSRAEAESDDPFEDPSVAELRAENARLRAAQQPATDLGPDNPARRAQSDLSAFQSETLPDGRPKRPLFDQLTPQIAAAARDHVQRTGQAVTTADLSRFYDDAESQIKAKLGVSTTAPTIAAQPVAPVTGIDPKKAAAIAKAQAASKSLDGAGQGANRHSAPPADASIAQTLKYFMGGNQD